MKRLSRAALSAAASMLARFAVPNSAVRYLLTGKDGPDSLVLKVRAAVKSVRSEVVAARIREVLSCDVRRELARVTVPILYVRATRDRLVGSSSLDEIKQFYPRIGFAEIDAPHLLIQREPQKAATIVAEFINEL